MTGGRVMTPFEVDSVHERLGLDRRETHMEMMYLRDKELIRLRNQLGDITQPGIDEVEAKLTEPDRRSDNFPAVNAIYIQNMFGSQIQQGTVGSQQTQTNQIPDIATLRSFIADFRAALPKLEVSDDDRRLGESEVARLETQAVAQAPNVKIVRQSMEILRDLLIGAGGSLIAVGILTKYPHLFAWITP